MLTRELLVVDTPDVTRVFLGAAHSHRELEKRRGFVVDDDADSQGAAAAAATVRAEKLMRLPSSRHAVASFPKRTSGRAGGRVATQNELCTLCRVWLRSMKVESPPPLPPLFGSGHVKGVEAWQVGGT